MKYEQAVLEILNSLIISDRIPEFNSQAHTTRLIEQAFAIADEVSKKIDERVAKENASK